MRLHVGVFHKKEIYIAGVILIVVVAVVAGLPLMLRGQTTTTGEKPGIIASDTLVCKATTASYPYLDAQSGEKTYDITVKMIYAGDELKNAGIYYDTNYEGVGAAEKASELIRATMNTALARAGYQSETPEVRVVRTDRLVQMSMNADTDGLKDAKIWPFLMLENADYDKGAMEKSFLRRGFVCE